MGRLSDRSVEHLLRELYLPGSDVDYQPPRFVGRYLGHVQPSGRLFLNRGGTERLHLRRLDGWPRPKLRHLLCEEPRLPGRHAHGFDEPRGTQGANRWGDIYQSRPENGRNRIGAHDWCAGSAAAKRLDVAISVDLMERRRRKDPQSDDGQ